MKKTGGVFSAELCAPIKNVSIQLVEHTGDILFEYMSSDGTWEIEQSKANVRIIFSAQGFCEKIFTFNDLPEKVRLLEQQIIGYQDSLCFKPGDEITTYVHSPAKYTALLYRHGIDKQLILKLKEFEPQIQQVPDGVFVESGLNWQGSFTYKIPVDAKPGIYSVLLQSSGQESFAIPMIVSSIGHVKSRLLVLASSNTWQSYNLWGGRSRYRNYEDTQSSDFISNKRLFIIRISEFIANRIPEKGIKLIKKILRHKQPSWKFKKLTIKRPYTNCLLEGDDVYQAFTNHLASSEWRLLAWLERENIDYDIISGFDLHNQPEILSAYQGLLLSSHCEYWTKEMFDAVDKYHNNHNLWLLNISGNTMYREVDFYSDGSTRCVSLSFHQSYADESQLTGVRFSMQDYGTCAPYKILKSGHWVFEGIPINHRYPFFGEKSLLQNTRKCSRRYDPGRPGLDDGLSGSGASGWETDKLTKTAPKDCLVIAKGVNKGGGADMIIREPDGKRGGMFSASSITFAASLLIDYTASELLKNIIQKVRK